MSFTKIGERVICSFQNGIYKHSDEYSDEGTKIVRITDYGNDGTTKFDSLKRVNLSDIEVKRFSLKPNDILINRVNSLSHIGKSCLIEHLDDLTVFESNMMCLRLDAESNVLPKYLLMVLNSVFARRYFRKVAKPAVAQVSINQDDIKSLSIFLPKVQQQTAISNLLSTWDESLEKTERLIAVKEKQYKWLSTNLLFGNSGNADVSKTAKWFAVPEHWEITKIGAVAKEVKATNGIGEDIPVLSCTKYDGLVDSLSYFGKQVFSLDTSTYKVVSRGEFAYATNHIEEGSIGYQHLYDKGLVSPMYTVFKTNKVIDDGYLYKVLKTETYRHIFQVNTSASVDRRGSLRWNEFAKLPIPLPPIEEQQKISATLNVARQEIDLLKKQADALRRQKRGLMQKLLTGLWRISFDKETDK